MIRKTLQRPHQAASRRSTPWTRLHAFAAASHPGPGLVGLIAALLLLVIASLVLAGETAFGQPSERIGVPSAEEAESLLALAIARDARAQDNLVALEADHIATQDSLDILDARQGDLLVELADARSDAIELAVASYIGGGEAVKEVELLLGPGRASDISWRRHLVVAQASNVSFAASEYSDLAFEAGTELHQLAIGAQRAQVAYEVGLAETSNAATHLAETEQLHLIALAWHRSDVAVSEGRYGEAPASNWERLRMCEASGNYGAISKSGIYRGAYQFDRQTWRTVGGTGDPAAAPPLEQDARARELFARRGNAPWPVCGRFLP